MCILLHANAIQIDHNLYLYAIRSLSFLYLYHNQTPRARQANKMPLFPNIRISPAVHATNGVKQRLPLALARCSRLRARTHARRA